MMDRPMDSDTLRLQVETARRLARCLVYGDAAVDDVVQEAALAALVARTTPRSPGAWIRGVTRNVVRGRARSASRRRARERVAARREVQADPTALVATIEEHARLLQRVRALPAPYQAAIALRYLHDLTPLQVAERLDLPLGTVKTQLKRGLARLRTDLDEAHAGNRRAWCALLIGTSSFAPAAVTATGAALGGFAVNKLMIGATATLLLVASAIWVADPFDWRDTDETQRTPELLTSSADHLNQAASAQPPATLQGQRAPTSATPRDPVDAPSPQTPPPQITGRVVDAHGNPVRHALVWLDDYGPTMYAPPVDDEGRYALPATAGAHVLCARAPKTATTRQAMRVSPTGRTAAADLVLTQGGTIRGQVVDARGNPLPFIRVRCWSENAEHASEVGRAGTRYLIGGDDVATKADGLFTLRGLEDEPHRVFVDLSLVPNLRAVNDSFDKVHPGGAPLTFRIVAKHTVSGQVVDAATGQPIPWFQVGGREVQHAEGHFEMPLDANDNLVVRAFGYEPLRRPIKLADGGSARHLRIELTPSPDTGTLRLVAQASTPDGERVPASGWQVTFVDAVSGVWTHRCSAASGELHLRGVRKGKHTVALSGGGYAMQTIHFVIEPGQETSQPITLQRGGGVHLDLTMRLVDGVAPMRSRVQILDASGKSYPWTLTYDEPRGTSIIVTHVSSRGPAVRIAMQPGTLTGVPAGAYTLRIVLRGTTWDVPLRVPWDGTTSVKHTQAAQSRAAQTQPK